MHRILTINGQLAKIAGVQTDLNGLVEKAPRYGDEQGLLISRQRNLEFSRLRDDFLKLRANCEERLALVQLLERQRVPTDLTKGKLGES